MTKTQLKKRLLEAKSVLLTKYKRLFKNNRFDLDNKRMISDDGTHTLQWRIRLFPDQPVSYENQQTTNGTVICLELDKPL